MRFTDSQRYYWALPVYEYLQDGVAILLEKQNLLRVLRVFRSLLPLPPRIDNWLLSHLLKLLLGCIRSPSMSTRLLSL